RPLVAGGNGSPVCTANVLPMTWKMAGSGGRWEKVPAAKKPIVKPVVDACGRGAKGQGMPSHRRGRGFESLSAHQRKARREAVSTTGYFIACAPSWAALLPIYCLSLLYCQTGTDGFHC